MIIPGRDFLHQHPGMQQRLNLSDEHIIVDKKDWEIVINLLNENPFIVKAINQMVKTRQTPKEDIENKLSDKSIKDIQAWKDVTVKIKGVEIGKITPIEIEKFKPTEVIEDDSKIYKDLCSKIEHIISMNLVPKNIYLTKENKRKLVQYLNKMFPIHTQLTPESKLTVNFFGYKVTIIDTTENEYIETLSNQTFPLNEPTTCHHVDRFGNNTMLFQGMDMNEAHYRCSICGMGKVV